MNRSIKFRAWDDHNKVMKFYTLKELAGEDKFSFDTEFEAIQSGFDNWQWMQFTGLVDKNGKEIYEGDVAQHEASISKFQVVMPDCYDSLKHSGRWQVVGNIHEASDAVIFGHECAYTEGGRHCVKCGVLRQGVA